jgi:hypothetical protein
VHWLKFKQSGIDFIWMTVVSIDESGDEWREIYDSVSFTLIRDNNVLVEFRKTEK